LAETFLEDGSLVKPKCVAQGTRIMADGPRLAGGPQSGSSEEAGHGKRAGPTFRRHGPPAPGRGNRRRSALVVSVVGLGHLAMHVAAEDERDRLASRMTFPVHVQAGEILWIET
jgi:hypothetical protein